MLLQRLTEVVHLNDGIVGAGHARAHVVALHGRAPCCTKPGVGLIADEGVERGIARAAMRIPAHGVGERHGKHGMERNRGVVEQLGWEPA